MVVNRSSYARAFMSAYIFDHSQCSPVGTTLYVDHIGDRKMYQLYRQETDEKNKTHVKEGTFYKLWQQVIDAGVTDPETCVEYEVLIRKARAKGFKKCNVCSYYEMLIRGTSDVSKRAVYERKYQAHIKEVYADREELARIQRLCIVNPNHCGFFWMLRTAKSLVFPQQCLQLRCYPNSGASNKSSLACRCLTHGSHYISTGHYQMCPQEAI